jgi:hypothetical protein
MAAFNVHDIVEDLHAIRADGIPHEGDTFVVAVTATVNAKTPGARARISAVPVVVDVVVLDGNTRLSKIREYDAAACRVPNFKAVDCDIGARALSVSSAVYDSIQAC